ncbi:phosphoglycolate phosphatase [Sulfitobacter sp. LCG007]
MTRPAAIVFDLDGTLIHSAPDLHASMNRMLGRLGRAPLDLETLTGFIGDGVSTLVARSLEATGGRTPAEHEEALALFREIYDTHSTDLTRPYPGVTETLAKLRDEGIALGICTNKLAGPAAAICKALGLSSFFDEIVGAGPERPAKPDAAPLRHTLERLGTMPADAIYVGDSNVDLVTAANAGVPFRLFTGGYFNAPMPDLPEGATFDDWADSGLL